MATDLVHVLNTKTGRVGTERRSIFEHKTLNPGVLVEVDANSKPYHPELFKPRDAESFTDEKPKRVKAPTPNDLKHEIDDSKDTE